MHLIPSAPPQAPVLTVKLAANSREIEQALRLRYAVFVEETGNQRLTRPGGLEYDDYDGDCDHLIVCDQATGAVVGTYRLLPGERAIRRSGFYSETEFNLDHFSVDRAQVLELGRSCIAAAYRGSRAIQLLWGGIAEYVAKRGHTHLIGCASMNVAELPDISELYSMLKQHNVVTDRFGVQPRATHRIADLRYLPSECSERDMLRRLPPLIKGYRWMGAEIAGEPAYDPLFDTNDFFIVFATAQMTTRYQRHFATSYRSN